jgi:hypothetical protein
MLDDNLNIKKLKEIIGEARFENPTNFKDFLKPQLLEHLALRKKRLSAKLVTEKSRYDLQIFDSLTNRETILLIGLKTVNTTPQLTADDIMAFQDECKALQALYGVLMTESEFHFYEFTYDIKKGVILRTDVTEIKDIRPLNHIDAEFERVITKQKIKDLLISRKKTVIAVLLILILLIASNLAQNQICKESGIIKGVTNSQGVKTYYTPESSGYNGRLATIRFCSEDDAEDAGFTRAK